MKQANNKPPGSSVPCSFLSLEEVGGPLRVQSVPQTQRVEEDVERALDVPHLPRLELGRLRLVEPYDPCLVHLLLRRLLKRLRICSNLVRVGVGVSERGSGEWCGWRETVHQGRRLA